MRAIVFITAAAGLCIGAYACGGASDAFVPDTRDSGADGTTAFARGDDDADETSDAGTGGAVTGDDAADGARRVTTFLDAGDAADAADGQTPAIGDAASAPTSDGSAEAAPDGAPSDDGAPPDGPVPGRIACGETTCATSTQFCCAELDGGASCQTSEQACLALAGVPRQCEKTADCPENNVCCYEFSSVPATTSCHANDCNGGNGMRVEACRSQGDCTTGTCATHTCLAGGSIQSCAAFATQCP